VIDAFQTLIDKHAARMKLLRESLERDACIHAASRRDPSHSILLTRTAAARLHGGSRVLST
jgi:hypothetical protein